MQNTVKVDYTEQLTYAEWERIHNAIKEEKKQESRYFIRQRIWGGVLALCAVALPFALQDITASIFLLPLGVGVMVTKDKVI